MFLMPPTKAKGDYVFWEALMEIVCILKVIKLELEMYINNTFKMGGTVFCSFAVERAQRLCICYGN
jgi:hypothetical protein